MPAPAVSVVIPARDAAATLPAALDALGAQDLAAAYEVIVVDDGSRDATGELAAAHPAVTRVVSAAGQGPGAARNLGAAMARAPVLAFTDADCVPEPGWLRAGLRALDAGADLVQGRVVPARPPGPWDRTIRVERATGLWETANLLVRRDLFRGAGRFEPWLAPRRSKELGEDVWLGWRVVRAGGAAAFAPDAVVAHAVLPRGPGGWVAEQTRTRWFPVMAARVPELRRSFLHRGRFLSARRPAVDLALVAAAAAAATRRPALLALAAPYAGELWRGARGAGPRGLAPVALTLLAGDLVTSAALAAGSLRARSVVL